MTGFMIHFGGKGMRGKGREGRGGGEEGKEYMASDQERKIQTRAGRTFLL